MSKYTILSIGPIYETMKKADNTRAVWTVSFMFSYLMRETIKVLMNEEKCTDEHFVVPCINKEFETYLSDGNRAGLFHDRLILKGSHADKLNKAYSSSVEKLSNIIVETFNNSRYKKFASKQVEPDKVKKHFTSYFQGYIAETDISDNKNPILELSAYVDAVEYEPRLAEYEKYEYLHDFLRLTNLGGLQEVSFLKDSKIVTKDRCFKSLPEISAWELIRDKKDDWKKEHLCLKLSDALDLKDSIKDPEAETDEIIKMLEKEFGKEKKFKPYHKYVAVVQADGDGFGKYLENIGGNDRKLKDFSTDIFSFAKEAVEAIEKCGGSVVMAGGDDLLFFAPVVTDKMNIFTLISEIDDIFDSIFENNSDLSMSYGVSITYYKFPLQEAFEKAGESLFNYAKQAKWINIEDISKSQIKNSVVTTVELKKDEFDKLSAKNAIHVNIRKHSGQSHKLTLAKNTDTYKLFLNLLKNELDTNEALHLPHALHHALSNASSIIDAVDAKQLENFFANQFDEDVHKTKHKEALSSVIGILKSLKEESDAQHLLVTTDDKKIYTIKSPTEVIFSMLSTVKLLRGDS